MQHLLERDPPPHSPMSLQAQGPRATTHSYQHIQFTPKPMANGTDHPLHKAPPPISLWSPLGSPHSSGQASARHSSELTSAWPAWCHWWALALGNSSPKHSTPGAGHHTPPESSWSLPHQDSWHPSEAPWWWAGVQVGDGLGQ